MGVIGVEFSAEMRAFTARRGMGVKSLRPYLSEPRYGKGKEAVVGCYEGGPWYGSAVSDVG